MDLNAIYKQQELGAEAWEKIITKYSYPGTKKWV